MSLRSHLARVRHLGSAKDGTHHWWAQRLSAIALTLLTIWFVVSLIALNGAEHATVAGWLGQPLNAGLAILLVIATFYHAYLGLQVVIEDYVHGKAAKYALLLSVLGLSIILTLAGVLAVLQVLF